MLNLIQIFFATGYFVYICPVFNLNNKKDMKKIVVSLCMIAAVAALSSCASTKKAVSLSVLGGEWDIIEINGAVVVPAPGQEFPYIGFDTNTGRVYGNSGCNRLMGTFDIHSKPGKLELGQMASTRMMCPDMTVEKNVLAALAQVKKFKRLDDSQIALCGKSLKRPVAVLRKRVSNTNNVSAASLEGRWVITEAMGMAIPEGMEKTPFLEFDTKAQRMHGNAGCNIINGGYKTDEKNAASISFSQVISTMMACPDMKIEQTILQALNSVKSLGLLEDGNIGFYDAENTLVLVLKK